MQISLKFGLSTNLFTIPINLYYCFFYSVPETVIHQPQLNQPKHTAVNIPDDLRHWLDSNQFNSTVRLLGHYNNKKYRSTLLPSAFSCHQSKLRPLYLKKKKKTMISALEAKRVSECLNHPERLFIGVKTFL